MAVELSIVETVTELETTVVEVVLESASTPGPAGPGVPTGGTDGQVLTKASATDFDTAWEDSAGGGGGAPTTVDYLVGTASGDLSAEIVVGTTPGGELGGTWASPTVDATHSGSSHASIQAAAEATAAAALSAHLADAADAHDASAISVADVGTFYTATDVEGVLAEIAPQLGGGSGESFQRDISQATHGLAVGDVVRHNGTIYVKAQADSAANAEVVGIVAAVADVNNFTLHYGGRITGLSGLSAGSVYYLDDDTAGLLTTTEPPDIGDVSKPLLMADSTTTGYFFNWRGALNVEDKQPLDADLTAIAALTTTATGRAVLTKTSQTEPTTINEIVAVLQNWGISA